MVAEILRKRTKALMSLVFIVLCYTHVFAQRTTNVCAVSSVAATQTCSVQDDNYSYMSTNKTTWGSDFQVKYLQGRIELAIDEDDLDFQDEEYSVDVEISVSYEIWDEGTSDFQTVTISPNPVLTVNYEKDDEFKHKHILTIDNAHKIDITIVDVTSDPTSVSVMNLTLKSKIEFEYADAFEAAPATDPFTTVTKTYNSSTGDLEITWNTVDGAVSYDLEWMHVNNFAGTYTSGSFDKLSESSIELDERAFEYNSTRVSLTPQTTNTYKIPLVYDQGYILFRLRAVGYDITEDLDEEIYGKWTTDYMTQPINDVGDISSTYKYEITTGHEEDLNWQRTTEYGEEGKNKVVLSYFDGSNRNRQSVTRLNTDYVTVAGETIYDYEGRPAIEVLSVPAYDDPATPVTSLDYIPGFNLYDNGSTVVPYTREYFDLDNSSCTNDISAEPMATDNGASFYYSSSNTNGNPYIPDALEYPFTQTEYTPDNTGRINARGGVGAHHQLGTGHETKYFYGVPFQEELDQLFGSEVGYAEHYKKNMVVDPNGQVSISYMNNSEKVIASSLAGTADNLSSLSSVTLNSTTLEPEYGIIQVDLLNKVSSTDNSGSGNKLDLDAGTLSVSKQILVPFKETREFDYKSNGQRYEEYCDAYTQYFCYDCVLELDISLTDRCGNNYLSGATNEIIGSGILSEMETNSSYDPNLCSSTAPGSLGDPPSFGSDVDIAATWETTSDLEVGEYSLNKVLKVNQEALDYYTNDYLENNQCLNTYQYYLALETARIDFTKCGECEEDCEDDITPCTAKRMMMLADVSPFGQYGEIMEGGNIVAGVISPFQTGDINPEKYPLSVFNSNNLLPKKTEHIDLQIEPNWRYPYDPDQAGDEKYFYMDENGDRSLVEVIYLGDGEYEPEIVEVAQGIYHGETDQDLPEGMNELLMVGDDGKYYIYPQYLLNVEDFLQHWQPSWADALIYYHPEYCYLQYCDLIELSHEWDESWMEDPQDIDLPYANDFEPDYITDHDPYFDPLQIFDDPDEMALLKTAMNNALSDFMGSGKNIIEVVCEIVNCPNGYFYNCTGCPTCSTAVLTTEEEWDVFKMLYMSLKQQIQQKRATEYAIKCACYNGCIGEELFNPHKNDFYGYDYPENPNPWVNAPYNFTYFNSQFYNFEQPCNWARAYLYENKEARFPDMEQLMNYNLNPSPCYSSGKYEIPSCSQNMTALLDELENLADRSYFEQCSQCPIALEIKDLFNAIIEESTTSLTASSFQLSCLLDAYHEDIHTALGFAQGNNATWTQQTYDPNELLIVDLSDGNTSCVLTLDLGENSLYDFDDIIEISCLSILGVTSFQLKAQVLIDPSDADYDSDFPEETKLIDITGEFDCIDFQDCDENFSEFCIPTVEARQLESLLNTLAFIDNDKSMASQLISATAVDLSGDERYSGIIAGTLSKALDEKLVSGVDNVDWEWTSSVSGTTLTGYLYDPDYTSEMCAVNLYMSTYSFSSIVGFTNIKPRSSGNPGEFDITVLIDQGNGTYVYEDITGDAYCFDIGSCSEDLPDEYKTGNDSDDPPYSGYYTCGIKQEATDLLDYLNEEDWTTYSSGTATVDYDSQCDVELSFDDYTGVEFSDVKYYKNIEPDQTMLDPDGSTHYFIITAVLWDDSEILVNGYASCVNIGSCFTTINNACTRESVLDMILGYLNDGIHESSYTSNSISISETDANLPDGCISIDLTFPSSTGYDYSDLVSFSNIRVDNSQLNVNETSNYFVVLAELTDGTILELTGYASCNVLGDCSADCEEDLSIQNWDFEDNISYTGYPTSICGTPSCCTPPTALMEELGFTTDHNYKYLWANDANCGTGPNNPNTFRVSDETSVGLSSGFNQGNHTTGGVSYLMICGGTNTAGTGTNLSWVQEVEVEPYTEYEMSFWVAWLELTNDPPMIDFGIVDENDEFKSILANGRGRLYDGTTTSLLGHVYDGVSISYTGSGTGQWVKISAVFNSGNRDQLKLAITSYSSTGVGNEYGIDDIALRRMSCPIQNTNMFCCPDELPEVSFEDYCVEQLENMAKLNAIWKYKKYIEDVTIEFQKNYIASCLEHYEEFFMKYSDVEHHTTLYYYDRAGNLVRTVPPKGVVKITDATTLAQIREDRDAHEKTVVTDHSYTTTCKYNSLNQLVHQTMPDQDDFEIWDYENRISGIPSDHIIKDIAFMDKNNGLVITQDASSINHIFKTENEGQSWYEIKSISINDLNAIEYTTSYIYIVGDKGTILRKDISGSTWSLRPIQTNENLVQLHFTTDNDGIVIDESGIIWTTDDGGAVWSGPLTSLSSKLSGLVTDVDFLNQNDGLAICDNGEIFRTANGGVFWYQQSNIRAYDLSSITSYNKTPYVSGPNGLLLKRSPGGDWQQLVNGQIADILDVEFFSSTEACAVIETSTDNTIRFTTDGGESWSNVTNSSIVTGNNWIDISIHNNTLYALADNGSVIKSANGVDNWVWVASPGFSNANCLEMTGSSFGAMGLNTGAIYTSSDGGASWSAFTAPSTADIRDIHLIEDASSDVYGLALCDDDQLWYYNNTAWSSVGTSYNDIHFVTDMTGYVVDNSGQVSKITDAGATWSTFANSPLTVGNSITELYFDVNELNGYIVGTNGEIWSTDDEGATSWTSESGNLLLPRMNDVLYYDTDKAVAVGDDGHVVRTTNGGSSWNLEETVLSNNITGIASDGQTTPGFVAVCDNGAYMSYTSGSGWGSPVSATTEALTAVAYNDATTPESYAVGENNTLFGPGWSAPGSYPSTGENLNAIAIEPGTSNDMYVAGDDGTIYKNDAGSWSDDNLFNPDELNEIQMLNTTLGFAVGETGEVYKTENGGTAWTLLWTEASSTPLNGIYFKDVNNGMVVGDGGVAYSCESGTWTQIPTAQLASLTDDFNKVAFYNNTGIIIGANGVILQTKNGIDCTTSWYSRNSTGNSNDLNAIYMIDADHMYIVGNSGTILFGTSTGSSWTEQEDGSGDDWIKSLYGSTQDLHDVYFVDYKKGYAIGDNGVIIKTLNAGTTWDAKDLGTTYSLLSMDFSGEHTAYITAYDATGPDNKILRLNDETDIFSSRFYYDKLGRLIISQNSKQYNEDPKRYAYIYYDALGRIVEAGQVDAADVAESLYDELGRIDHDLFLTWLSAGTKTEVVHTYYDEPINGLLTLVDEDFESGNGDFFVPSWGLGNVSLSNINGRLLMQTLDPSGAANSSENEQIQIAVDAGNSASSILEKGKAYKVSFNLEVSGTTSRPYLIIYESPTSTGYYDITRYLKEDGSQEYLFEVPDNTNITAMAFRFYFRNAEQSAGKYLYLDDFKITEVLGEVEETTENYEEFTFESSDDLTNWGSTNATLYHDATNERMQVATTGLGYGVAARVYNDGQLEIGKRYKVSVTVDIDNTPYVKIYCRKTPYDANFIYYNKSNISSGTHEFEFTCPDGKVNIAVERYNYDQTATDFYIEDFVITKMEYEESNGFDQENLRSRIASVTYEDENDDDPLTYDYATHYSYDIHGNVDVLLQDFPELAPLDQQYKKIEYIYDLVSGKVSEVAYQSGAFDQFFHRYEYDADNRITHVYTSENVYEWEQDAKYFYYKHGLGQRVEIGEKKVQGIDYAYTIQGWLKGVNSNTLEEARDMGQDGYTGGASNANEYVGRDEFGYTLGYYTEYDGTTSTLTRDYEPIGSIATADHFEAGLMYNSTTPSGLMSETKPLYNGNISHMVTAIRQFMQGSATPQAMTYGYDQLNRLKEARMFNNVDMSSSANIWETSTATSQDYDVSYSYDANGNLQTLTRNAITPDGGSSNQMDDLTYEYYNESNSYKKNTNRLMSVLDAGDNIPTTAWGDIKDGQEYNLNDCDAFNYSYDELGNLIQDKQEEIDEIEWTLSGKVKKVTRAIGSIKSDLEFGYDAMGNRVLKIEKPRDASGIRDQDLWTYSYYVRDAGGNVMAIYEKSFEDQTTEYEEALELREIPMYGSKRLGLAAMDKTVATVNFTAGMSSGLFTGITYNSPVVSTLDEESVHYRGRKYYELSNHLGNVLTTVSDRKLPVDEDNDDITDYYSADVVSATDYYPFGMQMPDRHYEAGVIDQCLSLDNAGYVALPQYYLTTTLSEFTVEAWVRTSESGSDSYNANWAIVDFDRNEYFNLFINHNDGKVGFSTTRSGTQTADDTYSATAVNDGEWHHIVGVFDNGEKIIYIDGEEDARVSIGVTAVGSGNTRYGFLGDGSEATTENGTRNEKYYTGEMDEVRIWHIARSEEEIRATMHKSLKGNETGLEAYYHFNNVSGSNVPDASLNNYDGTAYGTYSFITDVPDLELVSNYRFGFNGMEEDDELKGTGSSYDFGARIYDPRIGRWLSLDPMMKKNIYESNYNYVTNNPILYLDEGGRDRRTYIYVIFPDGTKVHVCTMIEINNDIELMSARQYETVGKLYWAHKRRDIVIDLRAVSDPSYEPITWTELVADKEHREDFFVGLGMKMEDKERVGSQKYGWHFTSEFSDIIDAAMTKAEDGVEKIVEIDALYAMMAIASTTDLPKINEELGTGTFFKILKQLIGKVEEKGVKEKMEENKKENEKNETFYCEKCGAWIKKYDEPSHDPNKSIHWNSVSPPKEKGGSEEKTEKNQ